MRPLLHWLFSAPFLLTACSTTTVIKRGDPLEIRGKAELHTRSGTKVDVRDLRIQGDTLFALEFYSGHPVQDHVADVEKLVYRSRGGGAMQGLAAGVAAGYLLSGTPAGNCTENWGWEYNGCNISGGTIGNVIVFGMMGLMAASLAGHTVSQVVMFEGDPVPTGDVSTSGAGFDDSHDIDDPLPGFPETDVAPLIEASEVSEAMRTRPLVSATQDRAIQDGPMKGLGYLGLYLGPGLGSIPSGSGNLAGGGIVNTGFWGSVALGLTVHPHWLAGVRFGIGEMEAYEEDWARMSTLREFRLETLYFPKNDKVYLKSAVGLSHYRYHEIDLRPAHNESHSPHSALGGTLSFGAGYVLWLGQLLNIKLDAEAVAARYHDGATAYSLRPSVALFWY